MRYIESDNELSMKKDMLIKAICQDQKDGLVPFFVSLNMCIVYIIYFIFLNYSS